MTQQIRATTAKKTSQRWPVAAWLGFVLLAVLGVYKDLPKAEFFLDDYLHLHLIRQLESPFVPFVTDVFMGAFFRPAITIFWAMDYALFGSNAAGFYVMNIVYLLISAVLLFAVIRNLTGSNTQSGLATLLFAIGPVTGVGVQWLSNRFDLIGTMFFLASLLLFLRYVRYRHRGDYGLSLFFALVAFFCKEITITLPIVMVLAAGFMFLHRAPASFNGRLVKRLLSWSTPFFTAAAGFMVWRYALIKSLGGYVGEIKEPFTLGYFVFIWQRFGEYVWLVKNPFVLAVVIILMAFLMARPNFYSRNKLFFFGVLVTLVTAMPLVLIFKYKAVMGYMTPRFFFLPNIGMLICLVSLYDPRSHALRRVFAGLFLGLVILALGLNNYVLNHKWYRDKADLVANMEKIDAAIAAEDIDMTSTLIYTCLADVDVAIDTGIKIMNPDLQDRLFVLKCLGPTQTAATKSLYDRKRRLLNYPTSFARNPCTYKDLVYGVAEAEPRLVADQIRSVSGVYVLDLDEKGNMVLLDGEDIFRMIKVRFGVELADGMEPHA
ncbi:MAG: glycosyltransferase family 39 protein [Candidatus Lernaella stagnicola]|nr:glycosyltransferase family 39 protein [Candidatus Lernaella stagnicola]